MTWSTGIPYTQNTYFFPFFHTLCCRTIWSFLPIPECWTIKQVLLRVYWRVIWLMKGLEDSHNKKAVSFETAFQYSKKQLPPVTYPYIQWDDKVYWESPECWTGNGSFTWEEGWSFSRASRPPSRPLLEMAKSLAIHDSQGVFHAGLQKWWHWSVLLATAPLCHLCSLLALFRPNRSSLRPGWSSLSWQ